MLEKKPEYVLIGFGGIATSKIVPHGFGVGYKRYLGNPDAVLIGITDTDQEKRAVAESLGLQWFDNAEEALTSGARGVYIAANNLSHYSLALQAMEYGVNPLVEKPMATKLKDAYELQDTARAKGLSLGVDHMMVYLEASKKARELVQAGAVGEVTGLCTHMEFSFGGNPKEAETWRCSDPEELGGPFGDVLSHCLYMAEFLTGQNIVVMRAVYDPKIYELPIEEGGTAFLQFENGLRGTSRVAFNQNRAGGTLPNLGYELYGKEGVLRCIGGLFQFSGYKDDPVDVRLELERGRNVEVFRPRPTNMYRTVVSKHAKSIKDEKPMDGSEGVHNLELVLAAHASAQNKGVEVPIRQ